LSRIVIDGKYCLMLQCVKKVRNMKKIVFIFVMVTTSLFGGIKREDDSKAPDNHELFTQKFNLVAGIVGTRIITEKEGQELFNVMKARNKEENRKQSIADLEGPCSQINTYYNAFLDKFGMADRLYSGCQKLNKLRENINTLDEFGQSALMCAASFGNKEVIDILLDYGADINAVDKYDQSALMKAAIYVKKEVIDALLDRGADINAVDKNGQSALMKAASFGNKEVIDTLLDRGSDINAVDKNGESVLMKAFSYGNSGAIDALLDRGADINAVDKDGQSALMKAKSPEVIKLLKMYGAQ